MEIRFRSGKWSQQRAALVGAIAAVLMTGCIVGDSPLDEQFAEYDLPDPTPEKYVHCYGNGCLHSVTVGLSEAEWGEIRGIFTPPSADSAEERERFKLAISRLEQFTGPKGGTSTDIGGSFRGYGQKGQQDCIDEMINTTTYLTMMREDGLIRFHTLDKRLTNGFFEVSGWPHTASSIKDTGTGEIYVIDSWWLDNGKKPYILPKVAWKTGNWEKTHLLEQESEAAE